jgi:hypothetical protein
LPRGHGDTGARRRCAFSPQRHKDAKKKIAKGRKGSLRDYFCRRGAEALRFFAEEANCKIEMRTSLFVPDPVPDHFPFFCATFLF